MNLVYKIIEVHPDQHSIVVRFYTDKITEAMMAVQRDEDDPDVILRGRTDYNINLPIPAPRGAALDEYIKAHAPVQWLQTLEDVANPGVDTDMAWAEALLHQPVGGTVQGPDQRTDLEKAKDNKRAEIAAWRYAEEVAGVTVGGARIKTDRESQATIASALFSMELGFVQTLDWKGTDGWVTLDKPTLKAIGASVAAHVQSCFTQERQLTARVDAATTVDAVNAIAVPVTITVPQ